MKKTKKKDFRVTSDQVCRCGKPIKQNVVDAHLFADLLQASLHDKIYVQLTRGFLDSMDIFLTNLASGNDL